MDAFSLSMIPACACAVATVVSSAMGGVLNNMRSRLLLLTISPALSDTHVPIGNPPEHPGVFKASCVPRLIACNLLSILRRVAWYASWRRLAMNSQDAHRVASSHDIWM